jgi:ABC-2 type transport system permease protein
VSPRLFWHVVSLEARTRMTYRVDFWITATVGFLTEFGVLAFVWMAMFRESGATTLGGYDLPAMMLYYGCVVLIAKVVRGPEFTSLSQDVYEGGLNRYLVFPTSYVGFKYAQHLGSLAPVLLQAALFGVWFPLVLDVPADLHLTPARLGMAVAAALAANLLYFVMALPLQAVAFWADNVWSLAVSLRLVAGLLGGVLLPLALYPEWVQPLLRALPFRWLFDFPLAALFGRLSPLDFAGGLAATLAWTAAFTLLGRAVWRRGDRQYTGIGI